MREPRRTLFFPPRLFGNHQPLKIFILFMTFRFVVFSPFSVLGLSFEVTLLNLLKNISVCLVNKSSCKLNPCWEKVQVSSLYKLTDNCVNLQPLKRKEKKATLITPLSFTLHLLSSLAALRWDVNLPVNAVRKWMVQEGQELEISIRGR